MEAWTQFTELLSSRTCYSLLIGHCVFVCGRLGYRARGSGVQRAVSHFIVLCKCLCECLSDSFIKYNFDIYFARGVTDSGGGNYQWTVSNLADPHKSVRRKH